MSEPAASRNGESIAGFVRGTPGVTPPSGAGRQRVFVTDVIVELGFTGKTEIAKAEDTARSSGKPVEQVLLDSRAIDERQLSQAIAEKNGLDHVDLGKFPVNMEAARTIGRSIAARCGAVPIAFSADGAVIVAVQDPCDSLAIRRLETTTGREVRPAIAAASAIRRLVETLPEEAHSAPGEAEVPRLRSQRELQVDDPAPPADTAGEALSAQTQEAPGVEAEPSEQPSPAEPDAPDAGRRSGSDFSDALSMDLGPTTMTTDSDQQPAPRPEEPGAAPSDREEQKRQRELIEARGKVAELERRMEELVEAAEEATNAGEKIGALRRAIEENRRPI